MQTITRTEIDALIDEMNEAAASPANAARQECPVRAVFQMEDPIAWTHVFGYDAQRYVSDPAFYVAQTLRQKLWRWRNFPADQAPLATDLPAWLGYYPEYTFVGLDINFTPEGVPIIGRDHPLRSTADLGVLEPVDFARSGWMQRLLRWHDDILTIVADRLPVSLYEITGIWWRGCLDLAIEMRGYDNWVLDTVERREFVHDLMKWLVEQRCRWYEAYYRHFGVGRTPVFVGDDWINVPFITPDMFAEYVLPRYREIEVFHGGITSIHSCGNQVPVQRFMLELSSIETFEISPWSDLEQSLANIPRDKKLVCIVHANDVLFAAPEKIERQLRTIAELCRGRSYTVSTSGLTPTSDDITEFIERIQTWIEIANRVIC